MVASEPLQSINGRRLLSTTEFAMLRTNSQQDVDMKTKAIRVHEYGGPEKLSYDDIELAEPGDGEVRIRHSAIGLNFIDTYHRSGLYPTDLPMGLGSEAAGVVDALGAGVSELEVGQRVVYTGLPPDSYSAHRNFPAWKCVPIPDGISDEEAAAMFLKGLTAWYLLRRSYPVQQGDAVLLYAAAGGVGSIASQWGKHLGATVIGIVGNEQKAKLAKANGCAHVILSDHPDIPAAVRELTDGEGVAAAYDSVGKDSFIDSLDCLRPHGVMVTFGNATGPVAPFAPAELAKRHSLYVTRPVLFDFIAKRDDLMMAAGELFDVVKSGVVKINVNQKYALADAEKAHTDLEARKTTGSTVLVP